MKTRNMCKNPSRCENCMYSDGKGCSKYWPCTAGCPIYIDGKCACLKAEEGKECAHYREANNG